jgi:hypothetical protein
MHQVAAARFAHIRQARAPQMREARAQRRARFAELFPRETAAWDESFTRNGLYIEAMLRAALRVRRRCNSVVNFQLCCLASTKFRRMNQQYYSLARIIFISCRRT